jgi:hypothetical protein
MELRPISIKAAMRVVDEWHRHLERPQGARFAIAAWHDGQLVGVALVGNPQARMTAKEKTTAEVIRVATDGTPNACSFLYARAKRAAQALGFVKVKTKTLPEESGASLRAVGAEYQGLSRGGTWDRVNRHRKQTAPTCQKLNWEL